MTAAAIATMATVDAATTTRHSSLVIYRRERCSTCLPVGVDTEWTRADELFDALLQGVRSSTCSFDTVRRSPRSSLAAGDTYADGRHRPGPHAKRKCLHIRRVAVPGDEREAARSVSRRARTRRAGASVASRLRGVLAVPR
jgi:hypothetical protein